MGNEVTEACLKVSVLGCGWSGMPLVQSLVGRGHTVKGSSTQRTKLLEIARAGALPFKLHAGLHLDGERLESFFSCDCLVVTLPPPRMKGHDNYHVLVHEAIANACEKLAVPRVLLFSSTSVYPNKNGPVTEVDADYLKSPHSGVSVLEIEDCYTRKQSFTTQILRFGGLFGPERHPGKFMRSQGVIKNSNAPVNLVHLDDVVGASVHLIEHQLASGAYNLCAPTDCSRGAFYTKAVQSLGMAPPELDGQWGVWKRVLSTRIQEAGYFFKVADPRDGL